MPGYGTAYSFQFNQTMLPVLFFSAPAAQGTDGELRCLSFTLSFPSLKILALLYYLCVPAIKCVRHGEMLHVISWRGYRNSIDGA
jgi:hypothetical protein